MPQTRAAILKELRWMLPISTIAVASLTFAGWSVFVAVQDATIYQTRIRTAQTARSLVMTYQLDEETGIRGYTGTGAAFFLEPYGAWPKQCPGRSD
jgi:hypothetical protein